MTHLLVLIALAGTFLNPHIVMASEAIVDAKGEVHNIQVESVEPTTPSEVSLVQKHALISKKLESNTSEEITFSTKGSCMQKKGDVKIKTQGVDCAALGGSTGGIGPAAPGPSTWTDCTFDFCADGTYNELNLVGVGQCVGAGWDFGKGIVVAPAGHCRTIGGEGHAGYQDHQWVNCQLEFCTKDGYHASRVGSCTPRKAYGIAGMMLTSVCKNIGGGFNGNPADNEWTGCHVDWCGSWTFSVSDNGDKDCENGESKVNSQYLCQQAAAARGKTFQAARTTDRWHGCSEENQNWPNKGSIIWNTQRIYSERYFSHRVCYTR